MAQKQTSAGISEYNPTQEATLVLLLNRNPPTEVLLGFKKVGFGQGKYTGIGGKVESDESVLDTAIRELAEETGVQLQPACLQHVAVLDFIFPNKPAWSQSVYVFTATTDHQKPEESDEMIPKWFSIADIPYDQMWADGRYWLPRILRGETFYARFIFEPDNTSIYQVKFREL